MISLSPIQGAAHLKLQRTGDAFFINGEVFDFSQIQDGDRLPRDGVKCAALLSDVMRVNGDISMTLVAGYDGPGTQDERFPQPISDAPEIDGGDPGEIDWSRLVTSSDAATDARLAMREGWVVSPAQIRLTLFQLGLLDTVQAIADIDPQASIVWEYAAEIRRTNGLIDALAGDGFTDEQIDDIFRYAMDLVI